MQDFIICSKCEALLISDEFSIHACTPNYRFEGDYLFTRRQGKWRRIYLPYFGIYQPKVNTNNNSREDNRIIL
jgi:hypothetical protein